MPPFIPHPAPFSLMAPLKKKGFWLNTDVNIHHPLCQALAHQTLTQTQCGRDYLYP